MSYIAPAVLVYQQLANAGGVANISPDLDSVIVGPCFNNVTYVGTSSASLALSAALNSSGAALKITDSTVSVTATLPSQKPGQKLVPESLAVYVNNASVQTLHTKFTGTAGADSMTMGVAVGNANATAGSANLTSVTSIANFSVGDTITVAGAGAAGADLTAVIDSIDVAATTIVMAVPASTAVTAGAVTKQNISNVNSVTATKRAEPGDKVVISYTVGTVAKIFETAVVSVTSATGTIATVQISDMIPTDIVSPFQVSIRKVYNNQLVLKSYMGYTNYADDTAAATGTIELKPNMRLSYGTVLSGDVHIAYSALRVDLSGTITDIDTPDAIEGELGTISDTNPLALGVQLAMANTIGRILAVAVDEDSLLGYQKALDLLEGRRVYCLVPLTQSVDILTTFQQHVEQMSTPEMASWRTTIVNTEIPTVKDIGEYNENNVNVNGGNNTITLVNGQYVLTVSNAKFMNDGVVPGDLVHITAGTGTPNPIGVAEILQVINNQKLQLKVTGTATGVSYYVTRNLTRAQQSAIIAGTSTSFGSKRVVHIPQGAGVVVNGVTRYLPGYYLACAMAGLISGLPVQQSLTNIGLAGIVDVQFGNFYFTRAQMDTMAAAGTCLVVQESQGSIPYFRHSLTTDMTVLPYREVQQVKNIDYLSYYFFDLLKGYIGKWNITTDTLQTVRQTLTAGGRQLQDRKLPKIGAPLVDFKIQKLIQDPNNTDRVICELPVKIAAPLNYLNLYLII